MTFAKIEIHDRNLEGRKKTFLAIKEINEDDRTAVFEFLRLAGMGKINLRKKISEARQVKYLDMLKIPLIYFKKPLSSLNDKDMERFVSDLESNKIKKHNKEHYAEDTKNGIKETLKIYLKWRLGEDNASKLTNWISTSNQKNKTPEYLKEAEIETLIKACNSYAQRFLIAVLFDTGARIEEFLNIRREDITEPSGQNSFYKITLREEYSKTKGRTIGLYWSKSTELIKDYLAETGNQKPSEPIYNSNYDAIRLFLTRLGKRVLKRRVYPHLFRHSSATYYAHKLNRQQLCYRYGWRFSSNMPDIYISRAGMTEEEVSDKIQNENVSELKERIARMEHLLKIVMDKGTETLTATKKTLLNRQ